MDEVSLKTLYDQIRGRWDSFKPPSEEGHGDWVEALAYMPYEVALWAVKNHNKNDKWAVKLADIIRRAPNCPFRAQAKKRQTGMLFYAGVYIECIESVPEYPKRLGFQEPLLFRALEETLDEPAIHALAQGICRGHETLYGGKWAVATDQANGEYTGRRKLTAMGRPGPFHEREE